jgi:hypothetical protein
MSDKNSKKPTMIESKATKTLPKDLLGNSKNNQRSQAKTNNYAPNLNVVRNKNS